MGRGFLELFEDAAFVGEAEADVGIGGIEEDEARAAVAVGGADVTLALARDRATDAIDAFAGAAVRGGCIRRLPVRRSL